MIPWPCTLLRLGARYFTLAFLVLTLNFFLLRAAPGSPLSYLQPEELGLSPSAEAVRRLTTLYGLDRPLWEQYLRYLEHLLRGEWGVSLAWQQPVGELLAPYLGRTLLLIGLGFPTALALGVGLGLLAALHHGRPWERTLLLLLTGLHALPAFLVATLVLLLLAVAWPLFPAVAIALPGQTLEEALSRAFLPWLSYVLWQAGGLFLVARGAFLSLLGEEFIAFARAKGLPERVVVGRHLLRAALPPIVARGGLALGSGVGGVLFVEAVYTYPGLATLALAAANRQDYPVLEAVFLVTALGLLGVNLAADLVQLWLDPRRGGEVCG